MCRRHILLGIIRRHFLVEETRPDARSDLLKRVDQQGRRDTYGQSFSPLSSGAELTIQDFACLVSWPV